MAHKKPLEEAKKHGEEVIPLAEATVQSALAAATPAKTNEEFAGIEQAAGKEAGKKTAELLEIDKQAERIGESSIDEAEENVGALQELDREMRALYFLEFATEYQKEDYSFDARIGEAGQLMETLAKHYSEGEGAALAGILRLDKYAQALALLKGDKTNIPEGAEYLKQMEALSPQEVAAASEKTEVVFYGVDVESKYIIDRAAVSRGAEAVEGVAGKNVLDALDKLLKNAAEQKRQALAAKTPEEAEGFLRRAEASLGRVDVLIDATQSYMEAVVNLQQIPSEAIAQRYAAPLGEMKAALDGLAGRFTDERSTGEQLTESREGFAAAVGAYNFESMVISAEAEYARLLKTPAANPKVEPAHQHILQIAAHAIEDSKNTALSFEERKQMLDAAQEALESAQTFGQISKKKVIGPRLELGQFIKGIEEGPASVFLLDEDGKAFGLTEKGTEMFVRAQQQIQFEQLNARRKDFVKDSTMAKSKIVSANESRLVVRAAARELNRLRGEYQKTETTGKRQKILGRMEDITAVTESYVEAARATRGLHKARGKEIKEQAGQRTAKVKKSVDALGGHVKELCKKEITDKQREWLFEKLIPAETGFVLAEQARANIDGFRKDSAKWGKRVGAQLERFASSAEQFLEMGRFADAEAALQDGRVFRSTYLLSGVRGRVARPEKKEAAPPVEAAPAVAAAPKEKEKKEEFKTKELNSKNIFEYEKIGAEKGKPKSRQAHAIARKDLLNAQEARENLLAAIQAGDGQAAGLATMQVAQLGQQGAARMGNLRSAWSVREFNAQEADRKITVADNFFGAPAEGAKPSGKISGEERGRTEFTPDVEVPKVVSSRANSGAVLDEMSVAAYSGDAAQVNKISKEKMRTAINQDMDEVLVPMGNLAFLPRKAEPKPWIIDEIDEFGVGFKEGEAAAPFEKSNKERIDRFKESLDSAFHGMLGDITYGTGIEAGGRTKAAESGLKKIERNARKSEEETGKALAELSHVKGEAESEWIAMRGNGTEIPDWSGMIFEPTRTPTGWVLESGGEEMKLELPPLIALRTGLDAAEQKAAVAKSELNRQMGLLEDGQTALAMLQQIPQSDRGKDIYADSLSRGARMLGEASELPAGRESVKTYAEAIDKIAMGAGTAIDTWEMDLRDYGKYRWQGGAVDAYLTSEQRQEIRDKKVSSLMRTEIAAREEGLGRRLTPEERGRMQKDPKLNARFNAEAEKEVQKINQARMQEAIEMDPKNLTRFAEAKVMGYALYTLDAVPTFEGDVTRGTFEVAGLTPASELRATEAGKKKLAEQYEIAVNADRVLSPVLGAAIYSTGFWGTLAGVDYYAQETVEAGKTAIAERPLGRGLGRETAIARMGRIGVEREEAVGKAELMGALADSLLLFGPGAAAGLMGGSLRFGMETAKIVRNAQHLYFITDTAANMVNGMAMTGNIRGHDAWMLAFMLTTKKIASLAKILGATPKIAQRVELAYGIIGSGSIAWSGTSAFMDAAAQAKAEGRAIRGVDWLGLGMSWFPAIQGPLTAAEGRIMGSTYARIGMRGGFGEYNLHNMAEYGKWKLTGAEARAKYAKAAEAQTAAVREARLEEAGVKRVKPELAMEEAAGRKAPKPTAATAAERERLSLERAKKKMDKMLEREGLKGKLIPKEAEAVPRPEAEISAKDAEGISAVWKSFDKDFTSWDQNYRIGRGANEVAYTEAEVGLAAEIVFYAEKAYKGERTYEQIPREILREVEGLSMNKEFRKAVDSGNGKGKLYLALGQVAHGAELATYLSAEAGRVTARAKTETGFKKKFSIEEAQQLEGTAKFAEQNSWKPLMLDVDVRIIRLEGEIPENLVDMQNVPEGTRFQIELKVKGKAKPEVWTIENRGYQEGNLWYDYVGVPKEYGAKFESTGAIRGERLSEFKSKRGRPLTTLEAFTENILQAKRELEALSDRGKRGAEGVAIEKGRKGKAAREPTEREVTLQKNVEQLEGTIETYRERAETAEPAMKGKLETVIEKYRTELETQKAELEELKAREDAKARAAAPERAAGEGIAIKAEHFATQEEFYISPEKVEQARELGMKPAKKVGKLERKETRRREWIHDELRQERLEKYVEKLATVREGEAIAEIPTYKPISEESMGLNNRVLGGREVTLAVERTIRQKVRAGGEYDVIVLSMDKNLMNDVNPVVQSYGGDVSLGAYQLYMRALTGKALKGVKGAEAYIYKPFQRGDEYYAVIVVKKGEGKKVAERMQNPEVKGEAEREVIERVERNREEYPQGDQFLEMFRGRESFISGDIQFHMETITHANRAGIEKFSITKNLGKADDPSGVGVEIREEANVKGIAEAEMSTEKFSAKERVENAYVLDIGSSFKQPWDSPLVQIADGIISSEHKGLREKSWKKGKISMGQRGGNLILGHEGNNTNATTLDMGMAVHAILELPPGFEMRRLGDMGFKYEMVHKTGKKLSLQEIQTLQEGFTKTLQKAFDNPVEFLERSIARLEKKAGGAKKGSEKEKEILTLKKRLEKTRDTMSKAYPEGTNRTLELEPYIEISAEPVSGGIRELHAKIGEMRIIDSLEGLNVPAEVMGRIKSNLRRENSLRTANTIISILRSGNEGIGERSMEGERGAKIYKVLSEILGGAEGKMARDIEDLGYYIRDMYKENPVKTIELMDSLFQYVAENETHVLMDWAKVETTALVIATMDDPAYADFYARYPEVQHAGKEGRFRGAETRVRDFNETASEASRTGDEAGMEQVKRVREFVEGKGGRELRERVLKDSRTLENLKQEEIIPDGRVSRAAQKAALDMEGRKTVSLVPPPPPKAALGAPKGEGARVRAYESHVNEPARTLVWKYGEAAARIEGAVKGGKSKREFTKKMQRMESRIESITEGMSENQKIEFMETWEKVVGDSTARAEAEGARTNGVSLAIEYDISLNVINSLSKRLGVERGYGAEKPAALLDVYVKMGPAKAREVMLLARQRGGPTTGELTITNVKRTPVAEEVVGAVKKGGSTPEVLRRVVDGLSEKVVTKRLETSREELITLLETGNSREAVRKLNETLVDKGVVLNLVDGEVIPAYVTKSVMRGRAEALVVEQVPGMKDPLSGRKAEFNKESKTILLKKGVEAEEVTHEISHYDQYLTGIWDLSSVSELEAIAKATDLGFSRGLRAEAMLGELLELNSGKRGEVYAEAANEILTYRPGEGQYTLGEIVAEAGVKAGDDVAAIRRKVGKWTMERVPKGTAGAEARGQIDTLVKVRLREFVDAKYQEKLGVAWSDIFSPIVKDGAPAEVAWRVEAGRGEVEKRAGPERAGASELGKRVRIKGAKGAEAISEGASRPDAKAMIMTSPFKNMESVEAIDAIRMRTERKSLNKRQESYLKEQFESYDKRFSMLEVEQTAVADNLATMLQDVPMEMIGKRISERMIIPVYYAKGTGKILKVGKLGVAPAGAERVDIVIDRLAGRIIAVEGNLGKFWSTARVLEGMQIDEAIQGYDTVKGEAVANLANGAASNELTNEQIGYVRNRFSKEKVYARDAEMVAGNASKILRVFSHALRGMKSARGKKTDTISAFYNTKTGKIERFGKEYTGTEPAAAIKITVDLVEGRILEVQPAAKGSVSQIFSKRVKPLEGMQFREKVKESVAPKPPHIEENPEIIMGKTEAGKLRAEAEKKRLAAPEREGKRVREEELEKGEEPVAPDKLRPREIRRPAYEIPVEEKITAGRMKQLAKMADRVVYEGAERPAKLSLRDEVAYLELVKGAKRDKTQVDTGRGKRLTPKELVRTQANELVLTEFRSKAEKQQFRESINQSQDFNGKRGEVWNNVNSVTVIGDGHGDFASVFALLERAGVIRKKPGTVDQSTLKGETRTERFMDYLNKQYEVLIGENDHVVSMGDSFDGDASAMQLFTGLRWLETAAAKKGARVHMLMGNHEQLLLACMEHGFGQMDTAQMNGLVLNLEKFEHHFKIREKQITAELERTGKKGNAELLTLKELFYSGKYPEYKEIAKFFSSKIGIHLGKMRVLPTLKNFRNWYGEGRNDPSWWENAKAGLNADGTLDKVQNLKAFAIFDGEYLAHGGPNTNITTVEGLNEYYVKKFSGDNEWRTNLGARMPEEGNYDYSYLGKVGQLESGTLGWNGESPGVPEFRRGISADLGRKEPLRLYSGHSKDLEVRSEGKGVYAVDTAIAKSENLAKGGKGEGHGGEALVLRPGKEATIVRGEQRAKETGKDREGYSEISTGLENEISEAESIPVVPPTAKGVKRLAAPPREAETAGKRVRDVVETEEVGVGRTVEKIAREGRAIGEGEKAAEARAPSEFKPAIEAGSAKAVGEDKVLGKPTMKNGILTISSDALGGEIAHQVSPEYAEGVANGKFVETGKGGLYDKPAGFWVSWGPGWETLVREPYNFSLRGKEGTVKFNAELRSGLKLFLLKDGKAYSDMIKQFHKEAKPNRTKDYQEGSWRDPYSEKSYDKSAWEWLRDKGYDGVAVTEEGVGATQEYGWDAASIVIFNSNGKVRMPSGKEKLRAYLEGPGSQIDGFLPRLRSMESEGNISGTTAAEVFNLIEVYGLGEKCPPEFKRYMGKEDLAFLGKLKEEGLSLEQAADRILEHVDPELGKAGFSVEKVEPTIGEFRESLKGKSKAEIEAERLNLQAKALFGEGDPQVLDMKIAVAEEMLEKVSGAGKEGKEAGVELAAESPEALLEAAARKRMYADKLRDNMPKDKGRDLVAMQSHSDLVEYTSRLPAQRAVLENREFRNELEKAKQEVESGENEYALDQLWGKYDGQFEGILNKQAALPKDATPQKRLGVVKERVEWEAKMKLINDVEKNRSSEDRIKRREEQLSKPVVQAERYLAMQSEKAGRPAPEEAERITVVPPTAERVKRLAAPPREAGAARERVREVEGTEIVGVERGPGEVRRKGAVELEIDNLRPGMDKGGLAQLTELFREFEPGADIGKIELMAELKWTYTECTANEIKLMSDMAWADGEISTYGKYYARMVEMTMPLEAGEIKAFCEKFIPLEKGESRTATPWSRAEALNRIRIIRGIKGSTLGDALSILARDGASRNVKEKIVADLEKAENTKERLGQEKRAREMRSPKQLASEDVALLRELEGKKLVDAYEEGGNQGRVRVIQELGISVFRLEELGYPVSSIRGESKVVSEVFDLLVRGRLQEKINAVPGLEGYNISSVEYLRGSVGIYMLELSRGNKSKNIFVKFENAESAMLGSRLANEAGMITGEISSHEYNTGIKYPDGNPIMQKFGIIEDIRAYAGKKIQMRMPTGKTDKNGRAATAVEEVEVLEVSMLYEEVFRTPDPANPVHQEFYRLLGSSEGRVKVFDAWNMYHEMSRSILLGDRYPRNTAAFLVKGKDGEKRITFQPIDMDYIAMIGSTAEGKPDFRQMQGEFAAGTADFISQLSDIPANYLEKGEVPVGVGPDAGKTLFLVSHASARKPAIIETLPMDRIRTIIEEYEGIPYGPGFTVSKSTFTVGEIVPALGRESVMISPDNRTTLYPEEMVDLIGKGQANAANFWDYQLRMVSANPDYAIGGRMGEAEIQLPEL